MSCPNDPLTGEGKMSWNEIKESLHIDMHKRLKSLALLIDYAFKS